MAIRTYSDQMTADVAAGKNTKYARRLPRDVWKAAQKKLDMLAAAATTQDLSALPGNRFEELKHTKPGFCSVRINDQYRLIFRFENGDAHDVYIEGEDHTG